MITFEPSTSQEHRLLVFTDTTRPNRSLRRVIAEHLAYLFDDGQIDGCYGLGDKFTVEQLMQPGFSYADGSKLWGWFDPNALWRIPAWPTHGGLPIALRETIRGMLGDAFGDMGYTIHTPATVVTVSVPVHPAPAGLCRCGHDASDHDVACTRLVNGGNLGCGCLTWRAPQAVTQ